MSKDSIVKESIQTNHKANLNAKNVSKLETVSK